LVLGRFIQAVCSVPLKTIVIDLYLAVIIRYTRWLIPQTLDSNVICNWYHTTHTTSVLRHFFWDHPEEPVPEDNLWTLWCKGRLTKADTPTIRLGATPSGLISAHLHHPPHIFYRPDALPATQPTALKH